MSSHIALHVQQFVETSNKHDVAWLVTLGAVNHNWHRALVVRLRADAQRWSSEIEQANAEIKSLNAEDDLSLRDGTPTAELRPKALRRKMMAESMLEYTCSAFYGKSSVLIYERANCECDDK